MITVVASDPSVRKTLHRLIAAAGYKVAVYEAAEAFLDADIVSMTACLVLDKNLLGKSGLELLAGLATSESKCPVLFIAACDDERSKAEKLATGAVDFLCKPLDHDRHVSAIEQAVASR
jgi:FixJ family two-component response regulator